MSDPERSGPPAWADPAAWWAPWLRPWGLRAPLSGDVSEDIDASLIRSTGDQLGFININATRSANPELERRIVTEVASYGRQLGRILDAVAILARREQRGKLTGEERRAFEDLEALHEEVQAAKTSFSAGRIDRLAAEIRALAQDPAGNADALRRLRDALEDS
jgi:hypothetical protein